MRRTLSKPWSRGLALCLLAALAACASPGPERRAPPPEDMTEAAPPAPPRGPVTAALLVPRGASDERAARLGAALADAARLAVGDLGDTRLRLRVYDTEGLPDRAADRARAALAGGASVILGPLFAESTAAVGEVAAGSGVPVLSFSNDTAQAGGAVWITGYTPEAETRAILAHARAEGLAPVAVFHPDTGYGAKVADAARKSRAATGPVQGYARSFKGIEAAAEPFAEAAKAAGAGAVLLPAGGDELRAAATFMNFHALDPKRIPYLGTQKWRARATLQEPVLRGGRFVAPDPARAEQFARRLAERTGRRVPPLAHLGYDAVTVAAALADAEGGQGAPFGPAALGRARGFDGAVGPIRFTAEQAAERGLEILEVGAGEFRVWQPEGTGEVESAPLADDNDPTEEEISSAAATEGAS